MAEHLAIARDLLRQILSSGPEKGARLRPLLEREFERKTGSSFRQTFWNFPKFSAFLAANADLFEVVPPAGPGDITVKLRGEQATPEAANSLPPGLRPRFLPPPIWNAFANPDPKRRRFFHRTSGQIVHFIEGSDEHPNPRIAATVRADLAYVEVRPVSADAQAAWMREFLETAVLPESKKDVLRNLAGIPYSSSVNTAFFAALGDNGDEWRQFRSVRLHDSVRAWAQEKGVPFEQLIGLVAAPSPSASSSSASPLLDSTAMPDFRRSLHEVVDALDQGELHQVLLPASVVLKLLGVRRS